MNETGKVQIEPAANKIPTCLGVQPYAFAQIGAVKVSSEAKGKTMASCCKQITETVGKCDLLDVGVCKPLGELLGGTWSTRGNKNVMQIATALNTAPTQPGAVHPLKTKAVQCTLGGQSMKANIEPSTGPRMKPAVVPVVCHANSCACCADEDTTRGMYARQTVLLVAATPRRIYETNRSHRLRARAKTMLPTSSHII
jgi:hypothetical protein